MGLIKTLLGAPKDSMMFVFRSIHEAVEGELHAEAEAIRGELNELYLALEAGELDEEEFDELEDELLERLDEIEGILEEAS
jgi:hypothetical protein